MAMLIARDEIHREEVTSLTIQVEILVNAQIAMFQEIEKAKQTFHVYKIFANVTGTYCKRRDIRSR